MVFQLLLSLASADLGLFLLVFFLCTGNRWAVLNFADGCCTMTFILGWDQKNTCAFLVLFKMGELSSVF